MPRPILFISSIPIRSPLSPSVSPSSATPIRLSLPAPPSRSRIPETQSVPPSPSTPSNSAFSIVLIVGFETFNLSTYKTAISKLPSSIQVTLLTDNQLSSPSPSLLPILHSADVIFCSLIFDYDQVEFLRQNLHASTIFVFESALELMSETRVGAFKLTSGKGMPPVVKTILKKLGLIGREEDKLAGYVGLLKTGPKLLKWVPGGKLRDLRTWITVYAYWNGGGVENVRRMLQYIEGEVARKQPVDEGVIELPSFGVVHPDNKSGVFAYPSDFVKWYERKYPQRKDWPRVAVLLYRKHVVSGLQYINELIRYFEHSQLMPIPVFITGVEAHIIVRDFLTSFDKEKAKKAGQKIYGSNRRGKTARVDAIVSTIG